MSEKTMLIMPGKKMAMPKPMKRLVQIALAVGLTALVVLGVVVAANLLIARGGKPFSGVDLWLVFIQRTDIIATMVLTALVTVCLVYWQRDQERNQGGGNRPR